MDGMKLENWAVLDLINLPDNDYFELLRAFKKVGQEVCMDDFRPNFYVFI